MSQVRKIKIMASKPSTGSLTLIPAFRKAWKGDFIVWEIDAHSGVISIDAIELKPDAKNVFRTAPHRNGLNWTAEIDSEVNEDDKCTYSIGWTGKEGKPYVFDPIITIKPTLAADDQNFEPSDQLA